MSDELTTPRSPSRSPRRVALPHEVISHISTFLDHPSAVAFGAASRAFREMVRLAIWREIHLMLPEDYGRALWDEDEPERFADVQQAKEKRAAKLGDMLKEVFSVGDRRRWKEVEVLRMTPEPSTMQGMMFLLDLVSENLRTLDLSPPSDLITWLKEHDTLDFRLLISGISLPSLRNLRIGGQGIQYAQFIPHIFVMAPHLTSLDVHVDQTEDDDESWDTTHLPPFPPFERDTELQSLRISVTACPELSDDNDDDYDISSTILELLRRSPDLRQMSFRHDIEWNYGVETICDSVLWALANRENMQDICWEGEASELVDWSRDKSEELPALRRVALKLETFEDLFIQIPSFHSLEQLFFIPSDEADLRFDISSTPSIPSPPQKMTTPFARHLRQARNLRVIHIIQEDMDDGTLGIFARLDAIEAKGEFTGLVRSFKRGSDGWLPLIHVRLTVDRYEMWGETTGDDLSGTELPDSKVDEGGAVPCGKRVKTFEKRPVATRQHWTDYRGRVVPLELIEEMRVVQGASEEEWDQRGVEVVDEAWKVLEDWYKTMPRIKGR